MKVYKIRNVDEEYYCNSEFRNCILFHFTWYLIILTRDLL